ELLLRVGINGIPTARLFKCRYNCRLNASDILRDCCCCRPAGAWTTVACAPSLLFRTSRCQPLGRGPLRVVLKALIPLVVIISYLKRVWK
ncbi:hypothetical protein L9F63_020159, partial [Diploptera punctata]